MLFKKKRGMEMEMIGWWLIGLAILVIGFIGIMIFKGKGEGAVEFLKNLFRLRR